eukprot:scaffold15633_cov107-Isochrysis_galbana.AAC.4
MTYGTEDSGERGRRTADGAGPGGAEVPRNHKSGRALSRYAFAPRRSAARCTRIRLPPLISATYLAPPA